MVANFRIPKGLASIGQHRHFLRLLPLAFLGILVAFFAVMTGGRFVRPTSLKIIFDQALIAFSLSFNFSCGRFDLSLGAQRLAGTIVGGIVAQMLGLSGVWILLFSLAFGLLFGFITGLAFITLRVPPMVLGVGLGLVWECVPYVASQGKGLNLFGVSGVEILSQTSFVVVLMVVAGTVDVAFSTQMSATLGLASNAPVVTNMFAMILGGYIGSRSNQAVGIIVAALTIKLFSFGLTSLELKRPMPISPT